MVLIKSIFKKSLHLYYKMYYNKNVGKSGIFLF